MNIFLLDKRVFANVIKLRTLGWGIIFDYLGRANLITWATQKEESGRVDQEM